MASSRCPVGILSGPGFNSSFVVRALNSSLENPEREMKEGPKENTNKKTFLTFEAKGGASFNLTLYELAYNPGVAYGEQILKLCDAMVILSDCNSSQSVLHVASVLISLRQVKHKKFPLMIFSVVWDAEKAVHLRDELIQLAAVHDALLYFVQIQDFTRENVTEAFTSLLKQYRIFQNSGEDSKKVSKSAVALTLNRVKQGYMFKQGGKRKNWKRRYFILQSKKLQYYKDEKSMDIPKGCIVLAGATLVINKGKKNHFDICTENRTYHIRTELDTDWLEWVTVISRELRGGNMVFGSPLEYLTTKRSRTVSLTLEKMVKYLCLKAQTPDLFRADPNPSRINDLMGQFDANETKVNLITYPDPHTVALLLKIFYQEIPEKLFPLKMSEHLLMAFKESTLANETIEQRRARYKSIIQTLPKAHLISLKVLLNFFLEILKSASDNGLSGYVLGFLFYTTLFSVQSEETFETLYPKLFQYLDIMGAMIFDANFVETEDVRVDFPQPESNSDAQTRRETKERNRNNHFLGQLSEMWGRKSAGTQRTSRLILRTGSEKLLRGEGDYTASNADGSSNSLSSSNALTPKSLFVSNIIRSATEKKLAKMPTNNPMNHPPSKLDSGWKIVLSRDRKIFYYNKATKTSYWSYPPEEVLRPPVTLAEGWKIVVDEQGNVTYENIIDQKSSTVFPEDENVKELIEPLKRIPSDKFDSDGHAIVGNRKQMQDSFFMNGKFRGNSNEELYGVFDGHGSIFTAAYCSKNFANVFAEHLLDIEKSEPNPSNETIIDALQRTFESVDLGVKSWSQFFGTTALVVYIRNRTVFVANSGDSKAMMIQKEGLKELNAIHRVSNEVEKQRVHELGGRIVYDRVQGVVLVTRSIGDSFLRPVVTSDPEVTVHQITEDDEGLVLCSDGVWEFLNNESLALTFRESAHNVTPASTLCYFALNKGSSDNISAITVYFNPQSTQ